MYSIVSNISFVVLSYGEISANSTIDAVALALREKNVNELCGARFCPGGVSAAVNPNLVPPEMSKIHLLSGIFLGLMISACLLVAFGVDSLQRYVILSSKTYYIVLLHIL